MKPFSQESIDEISEEVPKHLERLLKGKSIYEIYQEIQDERKFYEMQKEFEKKILKGQ